MLDSKWEAKLLCKTQRSHRYRIYFQKLHDYEIAGIESIYDRRALALAFSTIEGQRKICWVIDGTVLFNNDVGKVWLDPDSMQVIRIERKFLNMPKTWNPVSIAIDYGKADIAGKEFWMPQTIHYEMSEKNSKRAEIYSVDYADYRKLEASTEEKHGQP